MTLMSNQEVYPLKVNLTFVNETLLCQTNETKSINI